MDSIVQLFITVIRMLFDTTIFGIPLLGWFVVSLIFVVILKFLSGKK